MPNLPAAKAPLPDALPLKMLHDRLLVILDKDSERDVHAVAQPETDDAGTGLYL